MHRVLNGCKMPTLCHRLGSIMLRVHKSGTGVCGIFTAEVAETKVELVHHLARKNGYPLQCSMEEA